MLDRKTKDIEARIELLEDRIEEDKTLIKIAMMMGTVTLVISVLFMFIGSTTVTLALVVLGSSLLVVAVLITLSTQNRSYFIYLKKNLKCNCKTSKGGKK